MHIYIYNKRIALILNCVCVKDPSYPLLLVTTTPIVGHIRYGTWLGGCWLMALIPPLHSSPKWTLAGMGLGGPAPPWALGLGPGPISIMAEHMRIKGKR